MSERIREFLDHLKAKALKVGRLQMVIAEVILSEAAPDGERGARDGAPDHRGFVR